MTGCKTILAGLFTFAILATSGWACNPADSVKAISFVDKATKLIKEKGADIAKAEMSKKESDFVEESFYVFAYDTEGKIVAHPKNAKLIGQDLLEVPDIDGKLFRKDIVKVTKEKGAGWIDYRYKNPKTGKIGEKTTYCKLEAGIIVCCGLYKKLENREKK